MADDINKLLLYIVQHPLMQDASREAQIDASATQDVPAEISAIEQNQVRDAGQYADAFAEGLRRAAQGPLVVNDTDPVDNRIADAFARFLVTTNLATSSSSPVEGEDAHYKYTFEVKWPELRQLAQQAGVNLDSALGSKQ